MKINAKCYIAVKYPIYEIKERKLKAELNKLKDDRECFLSGWEESSNA